MANPRAAQLVEAGMWLRLSGDHEGAKRLFDQALKLDPGNERALQLLSADPAPVAPPAARPSPPPPAAPATSPASGAMELDWGNATGFQPTPVPFIPPAEAKSSAGPSEDALDVPVDLEVTDDSAQLATGTLVFGQGAAWTPPPVEEVPWDTAAGPPAGSTMQFARPSKVPTPPPIAPIAGSTMQFARPSTVTTPPPIAPVGGGTMQFARPSTVTTPPPIAPVGGSTMQFARPAELAAQAGADPGEELPELTVEEEFAEPPPLARAGGTMQFPRPAEPPARSPAPGLEPGELDFAHPPEGAAAFPASGRPIAFGRPGDVRAPPRVSGGTMEFARFQDPHGGDPAQVPIPPPRDPSPDDTWGDVLASTNPAPAPWDPPLPAPSEPKFAPNATSAWDQRSNPGIRISELHAGMGSALDLVSADRPSASPPAAMSKLDEVRTLMQGAKDLLGLDDHSGAMSLIVKAQELAPNDPEVQALRTRSEATLEAMFESKLGNLALAPRVKLKDDEIIWLNLDHRAGFVLAQIDGQCTFEDLFSVSGMSRLDTARILAQLVEEGVISS